VNRHRGPSWIRENQVDAFALHTFNKDFSPSHELTALGGLGGGFCFRLGLRLGGHGDGTQWADERISKKNKTRPNLYLLLHVDKAGQKNFFSKNDEFLKCFGVSRRLNHVTT
jgi:hypothetical protein